MFGGFWVFCQGCGKTIPAKMKTKHNVVCSSEIHLLPYIEHRNYYSSISSISNKSPIANIVSSGLGSIFVGESVMFLCHFKVGQNVLLSCLGDDTLDFRSVRRIWPISDKFGFEIFIPEEDKNSSIFSWNEKIVCIEKFRHEPLSVRDISIDLIDRLSSLDKHVSEEVKRLSRNEICEAVIKDGHRFSIDFYNRKIDIQAKISQGNNISTERNFEHLLVSEPKTKYTQFLKVSNRTELKVSFCLDGDGSVSKNSSMKLRPVGLEHIYVEMRNLACVALGLNSTAADGGFESPRSLLMFGPSGCGKTLLCETLISDLNVDVIRIKSYEIASKYVGESENKLMKYFQIANDDFAKPTLILIEDVDNICPREVSTDTYKRISNTFESLLGSAQLRRSDCKTFVLCTSAHIENLNPILRRCGKIDTEIEITIPSSDTRQKIVQLYLSNFSHTLNDDQIKAIAGVTHGFVGADLKSLISKAYIYGTRICGDVPNISVHSINEALNIVKASAMREVEIENPNVKWEDIGGQDDLKYKLKQIIDWPLLHSKTFEHLGIKPPSGILMYGPPGCSKTMIAKALATEARTNFISIKGPELFSMWVGESERAVREVFRKAREVAPSIIFFDEIDAIAGKRSSKISSTVNERVLAQMLTEMDGITALHNVTVIAATNRPDVIDRALLRPGRLDRLIFVGLPNSHARQEIFRINLKRVHLADDVSLDKLVDGTDGYSGAEISAVCQEAVLIALQENNHGEVLHWRHFDRALKNTPARTTNELLKIYETYVA